MKIIQSFFFIICSAISLLAVEVDDVLDYWFESVEQQPGANKWFSGGEEVDEEIRSLFYTTYREAAFGQLSHWKETAKGRLALIIVLDQFPRNLYRNSAEAFLTDSLALSLSLEGIEKGEDRKLTPIERTFFYSPLEHAEDHRIQEFSIEKFSDLVQECEPSYKLLFASFFYYAVRHKEIIDRFGRYPHRNKRLNRPTTIEEEAFLKEKGSSF